MLRALGAAAGLAAVVGHPWPLPAALAQEGSRGAQEQVPDWDVPQGHFYTQTSPPDAPADSGYLVSDADGVPFWQEYRALGGPAQLGFPISSRYDADGAVYQAMQRGVLRWQGDGSPVELEPVFARLATLGFDDWLLGRGIPATAAPLAEDPELAEATRLSWLTHPQLRGAYFDGGEVVARRRFGLPMSEAERFGPYLAQRFDRAVLQLWLDEVPGQPGPGTVAAVNAGDLLWEAGLIPVPAVQPQPAPAPRPVVQVPQPAAVPAAVPAAPAAPGGGKQILVSLGGQWWYAYQDGELVYNGPVTTGRPELPTPMGRFSVIGRQSPFTFISPWPRGSPFWYEPSPCTFALRITGNGVYLHDAPWRPYYGPGTNVPHHGQDGAWRTGSHGCINMPYPAAAWLWGFAPLGTPVRVVA